MIVSALLSNQKIIEQNKGSLANRPTVTKLRQYVFETSSTLVVSKESTIVLRISLDVS